MDELEVCLGVTWKASQSVDQPAPRALFELFNVAGAEPCVQFEPEGPDTVSITWEMRVSGSGEPYEAALSEARLLAEQRFTSVGLAGRVLSAVVMTDEASAEWLADG
jgi:hypothetical protein